jgi:hypothetical protein
MSHWAFSELRGDDVRRGANDEVLFKEEQAAEGEYAGTDALVREVLQNAVDARHGAGPVRVRIALHDASDAPMAERLEHYFGRLRAPLEAKQIAYNGRAAPKIPCRFLVVEDFGTRGLEGDTLLFRDPPPGDTTRQYFYWFWRNIGRSGKTGDDLGRWGLGKTVYRAASRVGSMFGLTVRESDGRRLLMGQSVLQIHETAGREYKPEGYWCGGQNADGLPLPIDDAHELAQFSREWRITRRDEPGLSVVSPYVPDELRADRLAQAVALHFFVRILRGELEVEVSGSGLGTVRLDREGIAAACGKMTWDGPHRTKRHIAPPIEFVRKCLSLKVDAETELLGRERIPDWREGIFPPPMLEDLRRKFADGGLIGVRVQISLPRRCGEAKVGRFDVWLQRNDDGGRCDSYYVREGMTITQINSQASKRGVRALVVVDPGPMAELLGDAEGPAHKDWDTSEERPEKNWKLWKGRIKFVRRAVDGLVELLTPVNAEPNFDLLADFFSIERTSGPQRQRTAGDDTEKKPAFAPPPAEPKWYRISERTGGGGFSVIRDSSAPLPANASLRVAVAYDLPKGDPLRNWSKMDFEISNHGGGLMPKGKGLKAKLLQGNVLMLHDIEEEFHFAVDGFDRHRDLLVRVDELTSDGEIEA